jgi:hypothetical protein
MIAEGSSGQSSLNIEGESTKAVKDLLSAWGPIISKVHWEFIQAQDGLDGYAEISEGQTGRFGHLLV